MDSPADVEAKRFFFGGGGGSDTLNSLVVILSTTNVASVSITKGFRITKYYLSVVCCISRPFAIVESDSSLSYGHF